MKTKVALPLAAMMLAAWSGAAAAETTIRFAHMNSPSHPVNEGGKQMAAAVAERTGGEIKIELSATKIRFTIGAVVLTSKLIDGTFPDYARVIPVGNDKQLEVEKRDFEQAVDRVSTVASERGRAVGRCLPSGALCRC